MRYRIMHIDQTVATVEDDGRCSVAAPSFLPYNLYLSEDEDIGARVENLGNFYYWCASRVLTLDRAYAKEILNAIGATQATTDRDRAKISLSYHCVTLTDVFWVQTDRENLSFADVNLYEHSLSDAFVDISLFGKTPTAQNTELLLGDTAGDVSTQGAAPKAWIRREDGFYLLKDGSKRDVEAELLASRIARCFDVQQVLYEPAVYGGCNVTKSKLMTSPRYGIVPMEYAEIYAANHDTELHTLIRTVDARGYHMMNIVDYLIGNTDRHWGNWGFWIDNETNRPIALHPLMDFNKAFLAYDTVDGGRCLTTETLMTQREAAVYGVRAAGLNRINDIDPAWFSDEATREMFFKRLRILEAALPNGSR